MKKASLAPLIALIILGLLFFVFFYKPGLNRIEDTDDNSVALIDSIKEEVKQEDLLGRAEISFSGGTEGRNKNIELGISRINGVIVQPGEEFSFTEALGPVTPEDGYSEAKVFLNNEVVRGIGGGLCQVSTTLFQSAVRAGLPITERYNHTYSVIYYDVGLDATYADPGPDLKFLNDTSHPIIIRGSTKNESAVFEIYGVYDGRIASTTEPIISEIVDFPPTRYVATSTVAIGEQECINAPQIGYTTELTYNILYPGGERKEQIFKSTYKPLQRICYVDLTKATSTQPLILNN